MPALLFLKYNIVKRSEINGVNTVYFQQKDCNSWVKSTLHQKGEGGETASTLGKTNRLMTLIPSILTIMGSTNTQVGDSS